MTVAELPAAAFIDQPFFWDNVIAYAVTVSVSVTLTAAAAPAATIIIDEAITAAITVVSTCAVDEVTVESLNDQEGVGFAEGFDWDDGDHMTIIPCNQARCMGRDAASVSLAI